MTYPMTIAGITREVKSPEPLDGDNRTVPKGSDRFVNRVARNRRFIGP